MAEEPPAPFSQLRPQPEAGQLLKNQARWRAVADGYRHLRNAMIVYLVGVPLTAVLRVAWPSVSIFVALALAIGVLLQFLSGAVALGKKPSGKSGKGLPLALVVFAFVPVVNVVVFPLLLTLYTQAVGIDIGKRAVVRSAWVLLGCSVLLVVPMVFAFNSVLGWAIDPAPTRPTSSNPDPASFELLFGVAAGAVLWLGAYIVSIMILSGVPRAIEKRLRESKTFEDPSADFEYVTDE